MNVVLGEILPYATAIAISPIPIIATILMLMSARARTLGLGFLGGWVLGIAVAVTAFILLAGVLPEQNSGGPQPILGVVQLLLAAALLALAIKQWRSRPQAGEEAKLPQWMSAIDSMRPGPAFGLAFLLAAINPKNLLMAIAAGANIGRAELGGTATLVTAVIFVAIAALSVAIPVAAFLVAPRQSRIALDAFRAWLTANNATIMAVVLLLLGVQLLGKAIGSF